VLLVGLAVGAALWLRPGESAMTVAQFGVLAQGHRIGGVDVPAAEYSDAKPTADLGEYGQIPACAAVVEHAGQHLLRQFGGPSPDNLPMDAQLYDTAQAAAEVAGLLAACDKASRPCHFAVERVLAEQSAEVTLFRTRASVDGLGDDMCLEVLGNQVQARVGNVLFLKTTRDSIDEQAARQFGSAAAAEFGNALR
jgi:hypothetical protein